MDTDYLTEMAYDIIVRAARVSDTLKAELGAMARHFDSEDEWLRGVQAHLEEICEDPDEYVEMWDLEDAEAVTAAMIGRFAAELRERVDVILAMPMNRRGPSPW